MPGGHLGDVKKGATANSATKKSVLAPKLVAVLSDVKSAFFGLCISAGKQVLASMMEADRVTLCGPKKRYPDLERRAVRGRAHARLGDVTLGGRRIAVQLLTSIQSSTEASLGSTRTARASKSSPAPAVDFARSLPGSGV
jgi:hypothetical protein